MSAGSQFFVLDVGHGSCAALVEGSRAVIFDVARGATLLDFLREMHVDVIESVVVSHADDDHVGGLLALLAARSVEVKHIYINTDADKKSRVWKDVAYELDDLAEAGRIAALSGVSKGDTVFCSIKGWAIEVLAPRHRVLQLGAGNTDRHERKITSNSMSIVLRLSRDSEPYALLTGDLDYTGFTHLIDGGVDLEAPLLIVPHHGGRCGSDLESDAVLAGLGGLSRASTLVVSHGRSKFDNPRLGTVESLRRSLPTADVVCTQMSTHCLGAIASDGLPTVSALPSAGAGAGVSCAGSMGFGVDGRLERAAEHREFVTDYARTPLCRQPAP